MNIIELAREAGFEHNSLGMTYTSGSLSALLERFATLVRAAALEEAAPQPAKRVPLTDEGVELVAQWLDRQMTDTPATGPMLAGAIRHAGAKRITGEQN